MKSCPRCKAVTFDDMDTCYGCMHRFELSPQDEASAYAFAKPRHREPHDAGEIATDNHGMAVTCLNRELHDAGEIATVPFGILLVFEGQTTSSSVRRLALFDGEKASIGRSASNSVVLQAPNVSRHHARVSVSNETVWVEDLGSTNATKVKGAPIHTRTRLDFGDEFTICGNRFRLVGDDTIT